MYEYESRSKFIGAVTATAFAAILLGITATSSIRAASSPSDMEILMALNPEEIPEIEPEEEPQKIEVTAGIEPRAEVPKPKEPVKLVQKAESNVEGNRANEAPESTIGDNGDVDVNEPERPVEINKRALFSSSNNTAKDTIQQQVAAKVTESLKAGHAQGNTTTGNPEGEPSAKLEGRTTVGALPIPEYTAQQTGKVVVKIVVDRDGNVLKATAGAPGTTITDSSLRESAKKAALKAKFNVSRTAPEVQEGTITYVFRLK